MSAERTAADEAGLSADAALAFRALLDRLGGASGRSGAGLVRPGSGSDWLSGATPVPPADLEALREVGRDEDVVARFIAASRAAGCVVHETDAGGWTNALLAILRAEGARRVLVEPRDGSALNASRAEALEASLSAAGVEVTRQRDDETLFSVPAAVTGVAAAIAETGTLICDTGGGAARGSTLIPPVHMAVVGRSQVVADLFDWFAAAEPGSSAVANINMVTGPSKTADIEGILITGVHGPGRVHVVLIADG